MKRIMPIIFALLLVACTKPSNETNEVDKQATYKAAENKVVSKVEQMFFSHPSPRPNLKGFGNGIDPKSDEAELWKRCTDLEVYAGSTTADWKELKAEAEKLKQDAAAKDIAWTINQCMYAALLHMLLSQPPDVEINKLKTQLVSSLIKYQYQDAYLMAQSLNDLASNGLMKPTDIASAASLYSQIGKNQIADMKTNFAKANAQEEKLPPVMQAFYKKEKAYLSNLEKADKLLTTLRDIK